MIPISHFQSPPPNHLEEIHFSSPSSVSDVSPSNLTPVKSIIFDFGGVLAKPDEALLISYLANYFEVSEDTIRELGVEELIHRHILK